MTDAEETVVDLSSLAAQYRRDRKDLLQALKKMVMLVEMNIAPTVFTKDERALIERLDNGRCNCGKHVLTKAGPLKDFEHDHGPFICKADPK